jgi:hypothetical protein
LGFEIMPRAGPMSVKPILTEWPMEPNLFGFPLPALLFEAEPRTLGEMANLKT